MEIMNKQEYVLKQLNQKIESFKCDSEKHKFIYRRLRIKVFVLTALASIFAGSGIVFPSIGSIFNLLIVVVSSLIGILTSIEGMRKPAELWMHERTVYYALLDLKREIEFNLEEICSSGQIEKYFHRMQEILGVSNEKWNHQIIKKEV